MGRLVLGSWVYCMGMRRERRKKGEGILDPVVSVVPDTFDLLVTK